MKSSNKVLAVAFAIVMLAVTLGSCHRHACPTYSQVSDSATERSI